MVRARSLAALVAASALLLTGCGLSHPGVAATVGSDAITIQQVDDLANGLCASGPGRPSLTARNTAIQILVMSSLSRQFGATQNATYDTATLDADVQSAATLIDAVDPGYQETLQTIVEDYVKGQLMLVDIGGKSLTAKGQTPDQSTSVAEGQTLMLASGIEVTIDPRFGTWSNGAVTAADGSLSVPVSAAAVSSGSLPSFGTCG